MLSWSTSRERSVVAGRRRRRRTGGLTSYMLKNNRRFKVGVCRRKDEGVLQRSEFQRHDGSEPDELKRIEQPNLRASDRVGLLAYLRRRLHHLPARPVANRQNRCRSAAVPTSGRLRLLQKPHRCCCDI